MAVIRPYLALGLTLLLLTGTWYYGHTRYAAGELAGNTRVALLTAQHAQQLQYLAELSTRASEAAREAEQKQAQGFAAIAAHYEQDKAHAQSQADRVIADLRAGTLRLRRTWQCAPAAGVPETAAGAGQPDGDATLRAESAAAIVRIGAECDAQVRGLQAALRARP